MVYSHKFVAVVVCNGKIVREVRDSGSDNVYLPFGSDYSLRFKNNHSERAIVSVEIDGKDVLDGDSIVVDSNSTSDLRGFLEDGAVKNCFRFIKKTNEIAEYRGDFVDDGLIRVEWQFEKPRPVHVDHYYHHHHHHPRPLPYWPRRRRRYPYDPPVWTDEAEIKGVRGPTGLTGFTGSIGSIHGGVAGDNLVSNNHIENSFDNSDEGITVPGRETDQYFDYIHTKELENVKHSIVIRLSGRNKENITVTKAKFTRSRVTCPTCGKKNRSHVRYCSFCGTNITCIHR